MYKKTKSEWKTYDEMDPMEQMDFRRFDGARMYQRRLRTRTKYGTRIYEYLVETWEKEN